MNSVISIEVWWLIVIIICTGFGTFICGYGIGAYLQDIRSHENAPDEGYSDHETEDDDNGPVYKTDYDEEDEGGKKE